jgi:DNA-binding NtrC family response regulator
LFAALQPDLRVIFLTALASLPEAVRAMPEGACVCLVIPASFNPWKDAAERVLARAPAR